MQTLSTEEKFIGVFCPLLQALLPNRLVVSCENQGWLESMPGETNMWFKPDIFITNPALDIILSMRGAVLLGTPAHESILRCVDFIDIDLNLKDS